MVPKNLPPPIPENLPPPERVVLDDGMNPDGTALGEAASVFVLAIARC
jgi:hypothetical protein